MPSTPGMDKDETNSGMDGSVHAIFKISDISETVVRPLRDSPDPLSMNSPLASSSRAFAQFSRINLDCVKSAAGLCCADNVKKIFRAAMLLLHLFVRRSADAMGSEVDDKSGTADSGVWPSRICPLSVPPREIHSDKNAFSKYDEGDKKLYWRCLIPHAAG